MDAAQLLHSLIPPHLYLPEGGRNCSLAPSRGFHRTLSLSPPTSSASARLPQETGRCILQALLFLPPQIFADPYELQQRHTDGRLGATRMWGDVELEAPVSAVDGRGTALLLDLDRDPDREEGERTGAEVEVPLHLRYPRPVGHEQAVESGGQERFALPCPVVFWACDSDDAGRKAPFDGLPPPFTSPYSEGTAFHFLRTQASDPQAAAGAGLPSIEVLVPTGDSSHLPTVELGTTLAVLFAFLYIAYCAWAVPSCPRALRQKAA
ncbi:PIG-X/PBN1 protein [Calocera cornea HHB12733]|uniref:Protein PBN1 n=1 Tax=Calocera cornea HHB12733 TaxID=1353952 RepID=A0A165FN94_9BASI|nr:PIG-X/PBN1 protein [Calocera cornea HHB12733]